MGWGRRSRKAWETWAGPGSQAESLQLEQPHSAHKHGPPQPLEQGREPSTSLPSLESSPLVWIRLWSGLVLWQSHPCGLVREVPGSWAPSACSSQACTKQRTPFSSARASTFRVLCTVRSGPLTGEGKEPEGWKLVGLSGLPGSRGVSLPASLLPAESYCIWEVPRAKPGEMRHHQFTNSPASWAGSCCSDSPWASQTPPHSALPSTLGWP